MESEWRVKTPKVDTLKLKVDTKRQKVDTKTKKVESRHPKSGHQKKEAYPSHSRSTPLNILIKIILTPIYLYTF